MVPINTDVIDQAAAGYSYYARIWNNRMDATEIIDDESSNQQLQWLRNRITDLEAVDRISKQIYGSTADELRSLIRTAYGFESTQPEVVNSFDSRMVRRLLQHTVITQTDLGARNFRWMAHCSVRGNLLIPNILDLVGLDSSQSSVYEFIHLSLSASLLEGLAERGIQVSEGAPSDIITFKLTPVVNISPSHLLMNCYQLIEGQKSDLAKWAVWSFINWLGDP